MYKKMILSFLVITAFGFLLTPALAQEDIEGSEDHPMISRYEGSYIKGYETYDYDRIVFPSGVDNDGLETVAPEGKVTRILYVAPEGLSVIQVQRNYQVALEDAGFEMVYECFDGADGCPRQVYTEHAPSFDLRGRNPMMGSDQSYFLARLPGDKGDVYVSAHTLLSDRVDGQPVTALQVMEEQPLVTGKVEVDISAAAMAEYLEETGSVRIYGIHFDTDEASIQEGSASTLQEIALLLEEHPDLELGVAGHTDATGSVDYNMDLSMRRAEAVIGYLANKHGIDPGRLTPHGLGPWAPVAGNQDEDGRARNRRVELIRLEVE